jgi:hypothetical protein
MKFKKINQKQFVLNYEEYTATILIFDLWFILEIKKENQKEFDTYIFTDFKQAEEKTDMVLRGTPKQYSLDSFHF